MRSRKSGRLRWFASKPPVESPADEQLELAVFCAVPVSIDFQSSVATLHIFTKTSLRGCDIDESTTHRVTHTRIV